MDIFQIDFINFRRLKKFYRNSPKMFNRAVAMLLNNFAFGVRSEAVQFINRKMIVRNNKFVASRLRVEKALGSKSMNYQVATVGSVLARGFTGWREQELGIPPTRNRVASLLARRRSKRKQIAGPARLRPSRDFPDTQDYSGSSSDNRTYHMLSVLQRSNYKGAFIIEGHSAFKDGLYKFKGRKKRVRKGKRKYSYKKVGMLQSFYSSNVKPKKLRWLATSRVRYFKSINLHREWGRVLGRVLKTR